MTCWAFAVPGEGQEPAGAVPDLRPPLHVASPCERREPQVTALYVCRIPALVRLQGYAAEEEEDEDDTPTEGDGDPCPNCGATYQ